MILKLKYLCNRIDRYKKTVWILPCRLLIDRIIKILIIYIDIYVHVQAYQYHIRISDRIRYEAINHSFKI